jgi:hypothetical protein
MKLLRLNDLGLVAMIAGLLAVPVELAAQRRGAVQDPAATARQYYNQGDYDAAIAAATPAAGTPAAALVLGRAHLERFRRIGAERDLVAARESLRGLDAGALSPRDRIELVIGLAEALFLEDSFGPASQLFESILDRADEIGPGAYERGLDWWGTAVDRHAQRRGPAERAGIYAAVIDRMRGELVRNPGSAAAAYWVAAAARGSGDLEAAWNAAIAAWVRAPLTADRGVSLRADIDRLVTQAIIPERARQIAGPRHTETLGALLTEWEQVKLRWE